jgi:hypothetical protein
VTLEKDASELIASGMVTLNAKLMGVEDDKLVGRVVEIWGFFWDQVLTYVEGVSICFCSQIQIFLTRGALGSSSVTNRRSSVFTLPHTETSPPHIIFRPPEH